MMKFLGIDLGWRSQPTGLCCLEWREDKLHLLNLERLEAIADVLLWVDYSAPAEASAVIAVDAPTLIPNATGMRLPDRLTHKHFGRYHAGCYPANLGLPFAERTVAFGLSLEARGFAHAPVLAAQQSGRYQIEVFPHPAMIHLFGLPQILKYKKGKLSDRRLELLKLRQHILQDLTQLEPSLFVPDATLVPEIPTKGTEMKAVEDQLDALICAYVAAHWWYWGLERNLVLGDRETGYIVIPTLLPKGSTQAHMDC
ncbi:DUF429 domain-containing protein [Trichocoleus sp. FACHB-46]|uniref:DUF429 domain-containing protein n=1 Tax=Trichocoleus desertorum GB2-A4 TaxID=2933944 RepID=A0ABV0J8E7_9CYAN|nr:DUF429 domain-containing protein [Trichocoleus sp. FACHB-46]